MIVIVVLTDMIVIVVLTDMIVIVVLTDMIVIVMLTDMIVIVVLTDMIVIVVLTGVIGHSNSTVHVYRSSALASLSGQSFLQEEYIIICILSNWQRTFESIYSSIIIKNSILRTRAWLPYHNSLQPVQGRGSYTDIFVYRNYIPNFWIVNNDHG